MEIKVSGRKTTVTDALRAHVDEKIGEALKVFDIEPMTADVVLRYEKNPSNPNPAIVEVTVRARGSVIRVAEHGADMYAAIDLAAEKVTRQLRKFKTRVVDNRQQGLSAAEVAPVEPVADLADLLLPEDEDDQLVRVKEVELTPMTDEEALVQTDLAMTSTCSRTASPAWSMWCITVRMVDTASSSPKSRSRASKIASIA